MARRGFSVFPIIPASKVPFTSPRTKEWAKLSEPEKRLCRKHVKLRGGIHIATCSPETIREWFSHCPEMNYGVSTLGLCVLDVDVRNGKPGVAELDALGPLPVTLKVQTPSGGTHLYYACNDVGQRKLRSSIDIRARGGYVVGPGSKFEEKAYRIFADQPIAQLPQRLRDEIGRTPERDRKASKAVVPLDTDGAVEAATAFLVNEPSTAVGERNMTAFRIACQLKDLGLSPPMIKEAMSEHWNPRNDEPLPEEELEAVAHNAFKSGRHAPGSSNPNAEFGDVFAAIKDLNRTYESRCFADIERKPITWLWKDRVALGKLTQIAGLPKLGKSQLTSFMAAAVTRGSQWPDGGRAPLGSVILISGEDDPEDTIGSRLDAAGADVHRVHVFDWARVGGKRPAREPFHVPNHVPALRDMIRDIGDVRMVVIDPLPAYMSGSDTHKTGEVRSAMLPLQSLAAQENVAIVLVNHLNKNSKERSAINRVGGSGAFVAVCRSNWLVAMDPDEDHLEERRRRRLLMSLGSNIGRDKGGLAFHVEDVTLPGEIETTKLRFESTPVDASADDVLNVVSDGAGGALHEAEQFLRRELVSGEALSKLVMVHAMELGIAPATLSRAKKKLNVGARKRGKDWWVRLPPLEVPRAEAEFADVITD
jgi:hypothetical protein